MGEREGTASEMQTRKVFLCRLEPCVDSQGKVGRRVQVKDILDGGQGVPHIPATQGQQRAQIRSKLATLQCDSPTRVACDQVAAC